MCSEPACLIMKRRYSATIVRHQSPSRLNDNKQNYNIFSNKINKQYDRIFLVYNIYISTTIAMLRSLRSSTTCPFCSIMVFSVSENAVWLVSCRWSEAVQIRRKQYTIFINSETMTLLYK